MNTKILKQIKITGSSIMIEGLPGIGNVGKIAADYMVRQLKAKKVAKITSYKFPNLVVLNEKNLIEIPVIEIYYVKSGKLNIFFVNGDFQPATEEGSFQLTEEILNYAASHKVKEIVTTGGIGLEEAPPQPQVFVTGNSLKATKPYKDLGVDDNLYGKVGTIIGVTGLLVGLAPNSLLASSLLVETSQNPGIQALIASRAIIEVLMKKYGFNISFKEMDEDLANIQKIGEEEKIGSKSVQKYQETNYIG